MAGVDHKHLQAAYVGLQKYLQQEWSFIQRTTQGRGEEFWSIEKALWEELLPDLFLGAEEHMPDQTIMGFPVEHAGLTMIDPTQTSQRNWNALDVVTRDLITALRGRVKF